MVGMLPIVVAKPILLVKSYPTFGVYTICMVMYGSGVVIGMAHLIIVIRLPVLTLSALLLATTAIAFCAAAVGATLPGAAVLPIGPNSSPILPTTVSASGCCFFLSSPNFELNNNLYEAAFSEGGTTETRCSLVLHLPAFRSICSLYNTVFVWHKIPVQSLAFAK